MTRAPFGLIGLSAALLLHAGCMAAQPRQTSADELLARINDYRSADRFCDGRTMLSASPLAPHPALAKLPLARDANLTALLKRAGYKASRAQAIVVSGPRDPGQAMRVLRDKYCEALLDAHFTQIGVARDGSSWRLVLAQPLLSPDLGDWREAGRQVLALTNAARAVARSCGGQTFPAAGPVTWDSRLADAALAHARDMARGNYFSHTGRDGSRVGARADRAGYSWTRVGENIATGQGSAQRVVDGWLASPSHCANVMNPAFTHMGAAYALDSHADTTIYWTQVFGAPR